ncbi:M10 family metallopeptidase C-terminal domain-containing protein [Roseomonas sp. CCTCC AB2023176]|uniref:pectate lyase family protein n=1 Tax=Roseomonas sp. CCTCC AB2023176 TaxID=3342640 RepID=UPI0035DB985D
MNTKAHGFASLNGGTDGGAGGTTITVHTGRELNEVLARAGTGPLTIVVDGTITPENTGSSEIKVADEHNLSIIGGGKGAEFRGIGIHITDGSSDIVVQNLKIHDVATGPKDAIGIDDGSHNIWIDHNELYSSLTVNKDYYDGLLDMKRGVEYVTVSNNYFHDHHKASLNGYSDDDAGNRYVTYDHNLFEDIGSRTPSVRFGHAHVYDNVYKNIEVSAINLRMGAVGLIENNVFEDAKNPVASLDSDKIGYWDLRGNQFTNVTWSSVGSNEAVAGPTAKSTAHYDVPYGYSLTPTSDVKGYVLQHAGVGKLGLDAGTPSPVQPSPTPSPDDPTTVPSAPTEVATGGADRLVGTAGADRLNALGGRDWVNGGAGSDTVQGGTNDDTLLGGDGADLVTGDTGNDSLEGGAGRDLLDGGAGRDTLFGGPDADTLRGGDGNDALRGGDGGDLLLGGAGVDILTGGTGNDTFAFASTKDSPVGSGHDVILDFTPGDRIGLSGIDARPDLAGDQGFRWMGSADFTGAGQLHAVISHGSTFIEADVNGDGRADFQVELAGVYRLTTADLIL